MNPLKEDNSRELAKFMAGENKILANLTQRTILRRQIKGRHKTTLQITCPHMSASPYLQIFWKWADVGGTGQPVRNLCICLCKLPLRATHTFCSLRVTHFLNESFTFKFTLNWCCCPLTNLRQLPSKFTTSVRDLFRFIIVSSSKLRHFQGLPSLTSTHSTPTPIPITAPRTEDHKVFSGLLLTRRI